MTTKVLSFSYKKRPTLIDSSDVLEIDCRGMANPHNVAELRDLTGKDLEVQQWLQTNDMVEIKIKRAAKGMAHGFGIIAFGCVGGRHRSVAMAEMLATELRGHGAKVEVEHTAL